MLINLIHLSLMLVVLLLLLSVWRVWWALEQDVIIIREQRLLEQSVGIAPY
jgi:hypothetical protein